MRKLYATTEKYTRFGHWGHRTSSPAVMLPSWRLAVGDRIRSLSTLKRTEKLERAYNTHAVTTESDEATDLSTKPKARDITPTSFFLTYLCDTWGPTHLPSQKQNGFGPSQKLLQKDSIQFKTRSNANLRSDGNQRQMEHTS